MTDAVASPAPASAPTPNQCVREASSARKQAPTGEFSVKPWKSRFDCPGATGVYATVTCCHDEVSVIATDAVPT